MKRIGLIFLLSLLSLNVFSQYHWTKYPDNPVMVPGEDGDWDYTSLGPGSVLFYNNTYHMYYDAYTAFKDWAFGYATSPDGITWEKHINNPILDLGAPGEWDSYWISDAFVVNADTIFHMWYTGRKEGGQFRIGHATSPDGIEWTKDPDNPVRDIAEGIPASDFCGHSPVIHDDSLYHMYYMTGNWSTRIQEVWHATSQDGWNWTNDPHNPVLEGDLYTYATSVIFDGDQYLMLYGNGPAWNWKINLAFSEDGSSWEPYSYNPVLTAGPLGSWEDSSLTKAIILFDSTENKYKMWYGGAAANELEERIGYAESSPFVEIPDTAFLYALIEEGVDANGDSLISYAEAEAILTLDVSSKEISDLIGIEAFVKLDSLDCSQNQLTSLDISNNLALRFLYCHDNQLTSLDVSQAIIVQILYCQKNQISSLDVTTNTELESLWCGDNLLTTLDISNNPHLGDIHGIYVLQLDISDIPSLYEVCVWEIPNSITYDTTGSPNVYFTTECGADSDTIPPIITILSPLPDSIYFVNFVNPEVHVQIVEENLKQSQLMFDREERWRYFEKEIKFTLENIPSIGQGKILVSAEDMSGNVNRDSVLFSWTHLDVEIIPTPRNLVATNVEMNSIDLEWDYSEDGFCIDPHYLIYLEDLLADTSFSTSYTLTQCIPGTTYFIAVAARISCWRESYMQSSKSEQIQVTTLKYPVGINAPAIFEFKIYPNPTDELLTIKNRYIDQYSITLSDLNGRILYDKEVAENIHQFDLSSYEKGVYLITIRSEDFVSTEKIIKL